VLIEPPPENIIYFYAEYQDTFGEIQHLVPGIKFTQGLPDDILDSINPETCNLFIIDDMMGDLINNGSFFFILNGLAYR
jgi:hypothetical protein